MPRPNMPRWQHVGTLLVLALALCMRVAARQANAQQSTFTCGEDQSLSAPIPLLWTTIVLAGDGRLYSPCPATDHTAEHREVREATVIAWGRYSPDDLRWRAAQAMARTA